MNAFVGMNRFNIGKYPSAMQGIIQLILDKIKELQKIDVFYGIYVDAEFDKLGLRAKDYSIEEMCDLNIVGILSQRSDLETMDDAEKEALVTEIALSLKKIYFFIPF